MLQPLRNRFRANPRMKGHPIMNKLFAVTAALALLSSSAAFACTEDELLAKVTAVTAKIQDLAGTDPQKVNDWTQRVAAQLQAVGTPKSIDELCKMYDGLLAGLN
jgi:hypothetical protein